MDYCSTCRRHLNGALVCPGCGAYAPDIAPGVIGGHRVPGAAATTSGTAGARQRADAERAGEAGWFTAPERSAEPTRAVETGRSGAARSGADARAVDTARSSDTTWPVDTTRPAPTASTSLPEPVRSVAPARRAEASVFAAPARPAGPAQPVETGPTADTPHAALPPGPGTGRAARRRQLARWKKTQRRALVATAVALVGGGITLASTDRGGNDRTQASAAPDLHGMGGTSDTADDTAGAPSASPDRTTAPPQADARRGQARPEAAPATTAPPSGTHTDGAAATEVPAGGRSDASESVSRSGSRSETSQDTGGGAPATGDSDTATRPATPPPTADDGTGTGDTGSGDGGSDQGDGSTAQPAPSTPPPADEPRDPRLCLLVICLG
ncbi:SCO2400 family protein [Streptomyces pseudogriseolus]|uniref:SCO2400 family protein n=1 Tax=Streptomyces pseudogriseolus TaxID=36817 RepID=UPI003FA2A4F2